MFGFAAHDQTGDGHVDIVMVGVEDDDYDTLVVLTVPGDGNGGFGAAIASTASLAPGADPMATGDAVIDDITGDGIADVVVLGRGQTVTTLLGAGDGSFGPALSSNVEANLDYGYVVGLGDFTGDGIRDIAASATTLAETLGSAPIVILPNLGGGSFGVATTRTARLLPKLGTNGGAAADLDGNSIDDLVLGFDAVDPQFHGVASMLFSP